MKRIINTLLTLQVSFILIFLLCVPSIGQEVSQKTTLAPEQQTSSANLDKKRLPKLLDLGAKKCIPCKKMAPILDEMENTFKGVLDVEFVDVWQPENKDRALKNKIESIPTQIFFDENGKELWRHVGFFSREDILKKWKELGYVFKPAKQQ